MSYAVMLFGAGWSVVVSVALVLLIARERSWPALLTCAVTAFVMPLVWNTILRTTGATGSFSHDLRFPPFPISWQDTGTGVFTFGGAVAAFALGSCRRSAAVRVVGLASLTALGALVVDVYAY